jgi:hypothetical protein
MIHICGISRLSAELARRIQAAMEMASASIILSILTDIKYPQEIKP